MLKGYNDSVHSSTGFAPSQVGHEEVIKILKGDRVEKEVTKQPALQVGDFVRVAKYKLKFEKGYETNYSELLYKICKVRQTHSQYIYAIKDLAGKIEPRWFYEHELSKVIIDKTEKNRIAKIVKERKLNGRLQYLVNWAGYPSRNDGWEYAENLK